MAYSEVFCAFTGALPDDADLPTDHPSEDEELSDLPVGWTRVTIQTRLPNPEWETINAVEAAMVKQVMEGLPKAQRREARVGVKVQIAAQFAALRAQTAPYLIQTETAHIAPGAEGQEGYAKLRTLLSLEESAGGEASEDDAAEATEGAGDGGSEEAG